MLKENHCKTCGKLLGKGKAEYMEIKCPRCKKINILRALSSKNNTLEQLYEERRTSYK